MNRAAMTFALAAIATPVSAQILRFEWSGSGIENFPSGVINFVDITIGLTVRTDAQPIQFSETTFSNRVSTIARYEIESFDFTVDQATFTPNLTSGTLTQLNADFNDGDTTQGFTFSDIRVDGEFIFLGGSTTLQRFRPGETKRFETPGSLQDIRLGTYDPRTEVDTIPRFTLEPGVRSFAGSLFSFNQLTITEIPSPSAAAPLALAGLIATRRRR